MLDQLGLCYGEKLNLKCLVQNWSLFASRSQGRAEQWSRGRLGIQLAHWNICCRSFSIVRSLFWSLDPSVGLIPIRDNWLCLHAENMASPSHTEQCLPPNRDSLYSLVSIKAAVQPAGTGFGYWQSPWNQVQIPEKGIIGVTFHSVNHRQEARTRKGRATLTRVVDLQRWKQQFPRMRFGTRRKKLKKSLLYV